MGRPQTVINQHLYERAQEELKNGKHSKRATLRLKAMVSSRAHGITITAKIFGVSANIIREWAKRFEKEGIKGLEYRVGRGGKFKIKDIHEKNIREWIKEDPNITIKEIVICMKNKLNLDTSKSAVHRALHRFDLAYITPRPIHYKQNKEDQEMFKKKCKICAKPIHN